MIDKLTWLTFKDRQLLCARSHGKSIYYTPGGKREPGESDEADGKPEGVLVRLRCYTGEADGIPTASAEIAELRWLDSRHLDEISPVSRLLFHWLKEQGLIR